MYIRASDFLGGVWEGRQSGSKTRITGLDTRPSCPACTHARTDRHSFSGQPKITQHIPLFNTSNSCIHPSIHQMTFSPRSIFSIFIFIFSLSSTVNGNGRFSLSSRLKHIDVGPPLLFTCVCVLTSWPRNFADSFVSLSISTTYPGWRRGFFFGPLTQLSARRGSHGSMRSLLRFSSSCSSLFFPSAVCPKSKRTRQTPAQSLDI